jgi:hypothetical protein
MVRYEIKQGENAINVVQFKEDGKWSQPVVASLVTLRCGANYPLDPFEMLNEAITLLEELRMVLIVLDKAQRQMGDDYRPPFIPFKDEYLPKHLTDIELRSAVADLYFALWERDKCDTCNGRGFNRTTDEVGSWNETCECASNAETVMARTERIAKLARGAE